MKWVKIICAFLIAFSGMCTIGFFGLFGICAIKGIFNYLFTYCSELIWLSIGFLISLVGVIIGWGVFSDGIYKLKDNHGK